MKAIDALTEKLIGKSLPIIYPENSKQIYCFQNEIEKQNRKHQFNVDCVCIEETVEITDIEYNPEESFDVIKLKFQNGMYAKIFDWWNFEFNVL